LHAPSLGDARSGVAPRWYSSGKLISSCGIAAVVHVSRVAEPSDTFGERVEEPLVAAMDRLHTIESFGPATKARSLAEAADILMMEPT
jgi:hypothetical protein